MSNESTLAERPAAARTPALPGDIIQVIDPASPLCDGFLLVEQSYAWGVGATLRWHDGTAKMESYHRVGVNAFRVVGTAAIFPQHVAESRRAALSGWLG